MPYHSLIAPSRQFVKPTASSTQVDGEQVALPVLEEVEIRYEMACALDLQGRKHLASKQEYYYGPQECTPSVLYLDLPMPGVTGANVLRDLLQQHLQPDQIADEYGDECDLSQVSNYHILVLQARLWTKVSNDPATVKAATERPSRVEVSIAGFVAKVVQLLEAKHIFVFIKSENYTCDYPNDPSRTHPCHLQKVRMEPLVHWGTVTPVSLSRSILAFRRDGSLMKVVEQPGYVRLVRCLIKPDAPTFCVSCLERLWSQRVEAQKTMRQIQSTVPHSQPRLSEHVYHLRPVFELEESASKADNFGTQEFCGTISQAANASQPDAAGLQGDFCNVLPQLDGASDYPERAQMGNLSGYDRERRVIEISSDSDMPLEHHTIRKITMQETCSLVLPLRTPEDSQVTLKKSMALTTMRSQVANENAPTGLVIGKSGLNPQMIDLTTPPHAKERGFGKELDANTKASLVQVRRSPRNHKTEKSMPKESRAKPVKPMKALKPAQNAATANKATKVAKKRKVAPTSKQTGDQRKTRIVTAKDSTTVSHMDVAPNGPTTSQHKPLTVGLQRVPKTAPAARSSSPPKLVVHFAKDPTEIKASEGTEEDELKAFQRTHPAHRSRICLCDEPAGHIAKKKENPQIAQCINRKCRFRWFHYACLNVSEKGQARYGNLLCSVCRLEQDFAEQDRKNGWSGENLRDFQPVLKREQVEAQFPGLGGVIAEPDPYGLGSGFQLGPKYDTQGGKTGTLGELDQLGYQRSHPEMLEEAYLHAGAYAELLARHAEEDEGDDRRIIFKAGGYVDEEACRDSDVVYDKEMDQEL